MCVAGTPGGARWRQWLWEEHHFTPLAGSMSLLRERFYWTGDSWEYPDEWVRDHIGSGGPHRSCYRSQAKHRTDCRHNCVARRWRCVGDSNTFRSGGTATLVPFSVQSQTSETEVADATQPTFQSSLPSNEINNSTPAKQTVSLVNPHQNQFRAEYYANSQSGVSPPKLAGGVTFERTHFSYPNSPSLPFLKGFNLELEPGKTVALVCESGCGKSTAISMVTHDPTNGMLALDGTDLRHINVAAGRAVVSKNRSSSTFQFRTTSDMAPYSKR